VKTIILSGLLLVSLVSLAEAQDSAGAKTQDKVTASLAQSAPESLFRVSPDSTSKASGDAPDPVTLPLSAALDGPGQEPALSIGPAAGYLRTRGADRGTWFGGVQARLHFLDILAAEASITFHRNEYDSGDVIVTQYPVQLTAFLYPIPEGPVRPYLLGGVGWYYTHVNHRGLFSLVPDKTEQVFGEHLGAGVELMLGPRVSFDADVRYIFLNPTNDQVIHRDFNYWQVTLGVNLFF
jgi:opacity protein-like surface antigen